MIVRTPPAKRVANERNDVVAGPWITAPLVLYVEPWHGQTYCALWNPLTTQPSCVQIAVSAVKEPADVCATRKLPADVWLPDQGVPPYRARG